MWSLCIKIGKIHFVNLFLNQGLGSGSVGSARFCLPGSGTAKLCRSTDSDSRGKISTKNWRKQKILLLKLKSELL